MSSQYWSEISIYKLIIQINTFHFTTPWFHDCGFASQYPSLEFMSPNVKEQLTTLLDVT